MGNRDMKTTVETVVLIEGRENQEVPLPLPALDTPVQAINANTIVEVVEENEYRKIQKRFQLLRPWIHRWNFPLSRVAI